MRRVIGVVVLGLWLVPAGTASAGTYDVYGCRLPDGKSIGVEGWLPALFSAPSTTSESCRSGGGLVAALDPDVTLTWPSRAGWEFNAPRDTRISAYVLHRSASVSPGSATRAALIYHDAPVFDAGARRYAQELCHSVNPCAGWGDGSIPLSPRNRYARTGLQIQSLIVATECMGTNVLSSGCPPVAPARPKVMVHASKITLADAHPPSFATAPVGSLLDQTGAIDGTRSASFVAEDRGGGVTAVGVVVDRRLLEERAADPNSRSCRPPYTRPVPCPLTTRGVLEFDTTRLANGPHQMSIVITDAAGNSTSSPPSTVIVRNPGAPNGLRASRFARLDAWFETRALGRHTTTTTRYGRGRAIAGRLTDESGAPIPNAVLGLTAAAARPASKARALGEVTTNADGEFRFQVAAGSSREVTVGYRAFQLDTAPSATATLLLNVRAGVSLSVRPRRASPRGRIEFTGRLRGGPGRGGTQVVIYALGGARSRIPVATVRADSRGRFRYRYRFTNSSPGTTYRFRATMHAQRAYPYATGSSGVVTVRIR